MNKFEKVLLTILFVELFVGGGGRLIDFGVLSIRQVLFLVLLLTFIYRIVKQKAIFNKNINTFIQFNPVTIGIYALLVWFAISALIGVVKGHPLSIVVMDFFRVSYFMAYFPLAYYISELRISKEHIIKLLKYSAVAVSIFTIVVSLLGKTVFSANFGPFYLFMNEIMNDDLFFRPSNSVFYKSHLFVLIALIIALNDVLNKQLSKINIALVTLGTVSVLWSETRGFLLALMVSLLMIILLDGKVVSDSFKKLSDKLKGILQTKWFVKKAGILLVLVMLLPFLYKYMTLERFQQDAVVEDPNNSEIEESNQVDDLSVNTRLEFIVDSKKILFENPSNLIIGTGYGTEIAERLEGIEMSFLDILVEQGLVGLAVWFFLFFLVYYNYYVGYKKSGKLSALEISLMAAFMGVLLVTNINPFINNPIGISFFLVVLILSQRWKESSLHGATR